MTPFQSAEIAKVFAVIPQPARDRLLELRELIFESAAETEGVGPIVETLRWGEPSYATAKAKSGTPIRIHWKAKRPQRYALYVHCQTTLVEQFRHLYDGLPKRRSQAGGESGEPVEFEGNRAVLFAVECPLPMGLVRQYLKRALTYHSSKAR